MQPANISLAPCVPSDFPTLVHVESLAYLNDEFAILAFGHLKDSPANLTIRTRGLLKTLVPDGQKTTHYVKALSDGEIVGWASWSFISRESTGEEGEDLTTTKKLEVSEVEGEKLVEAGFGENEASDGWGISANVEFCENVFLVADEWMVKSTKGKPYASKSKAFHRNLNTRLGGVQLLTVCRT
jgi:hypothetical protein